MKIVLVSDHAGFKLKQSVKEHLSQKNIPFEDYGCYSEESVDYVDYAEKAMKSFVAGNFDKAILICGTGLGMNIVANKFKGVIATPCCDEYSAEMSRKHNNSNCLTLGGRILPADEALHIVDIWLETEFDGDRHSRRMEKIKTIEGKNFKA